MTTWMSYAPSDLLLFSASTYYRLFERYNRDMWPMQLIALVGGLTLLVLLRDRSRWRSRTITAVLGAVWIWVAWAYHLQRYATINWAATWFAAGFVVQAAIMLWHGIIRCRLRYRLSTAAPNLAGLGIFIFALVAQPLIAPFSGRGWIQAEWFGIAPDPTAVGTLGLLLMANGPNRWTMMVIPVLWCLISGAVLWGLSAPGAIAAPLVALAVVILMTGSHLHDR